MFQHLHTFKHYCRVYAWTMFSVQQWTSPLAASPINIPLSKSLPSQMVYIWDRLKPQFLLVIYIITLLSYQTYSGKKDIRDFFFFSEAKRQDRDTPLAATVFGRSPYLHDNVSENNSPTSLLGLPSWLNRCHQEIKSHPGWWNWHCLLSRPKNLELV